MKRLGILFMVLVIALAGLGAAFAAWTDEIVITGTVNTGSVDIVIEQVSGTDVYKDLDSDQMVVCRYFVDATGAKVYHPVPFLDPPGDAGPPQPTNDLLVASASATISAGDTLEFTFDNIFPCLDFAIDAKFHYVGTVPAKINKITVEAIDDPDGILDDLDISFFGYMWDPENHVVGAPVDIGSQIHEDQWIWAGIVVHVPQDQALMGKSASGTIKIELVQWNKYPYSNSD